jgi:hypothetical protein
MLRAHALPSGARAARYMRASAHGAALLPRAARRLLSRFGFRQMFCRRRYLLRYDAAISPPDAVSTPFFAADLPPRRADCRIFAIIYSLIRRFAAGFDSRHFRRRFAARCPAAAIIFASQPLLLPLRQSAISIFSLLIFAATPTLRRQLPITPLLEPFHYVFDDYLRHYASPFFINIAIDYFRFFCFSPFRRRLFRFHFRFRHADAIAITLSRHAIFITCHAITPLFACCRCHFFSAMPLTRYYYADTLFERRLFS